MFALYKISGDVLRAIRICTLVHQFNAAAIMLVQAMSLLAGSNPATREEECEFLHGASCHVYVCVHVAPALLLI